MVYYSGFIADCIIFHITVIYRITYGLLWMPIFVTHKMIWQWFFYEWWSYVWKSLPNHLMSDKKISIHGNQYIILFLTHYSSPWWSTKACQNNHYFAIFAKDRLFWLGIVTSLQFSLWCHVNARYWHCDVIFNDCSCKLKLVQMWSSLVNKNHEYWFPTMWYSPFSV